MKCKLCNKETEIINSHIIPEFFYIPLYDEKHRFRQLSTSLEKIKKYEQKGIREKLLCSECENNFSKLEGYAARLFNKDYTISAEYNNDNVLFHGIDYKKFKLFQLSILWRASVSSLPFFSQINIGPYERKIKMMLIDKKPGEFYECGCVMVFHLSIEKEIMNGIILNPYSFRSYSHRSYCFVFGSILWVFIVSKHSSSFIHKEYFLQENGSLKVRRTLGNKFLQNIVSEVNKAGKLPIS